MADNLSVRLINDHVEICVIFWHRDVDVLVQAISGLINEFDLLLPRCATVVFLINDRVCIGPEVDDIFCAFSHVEHWRRERRFVLCFSNLAGSLGHGI